MIRFLEADAKSIQEIEKDGDYLIMGSDIWTQGREWFKNHRDAEKIPVKDERGKIICYAFQDMDANRELRMLEELCEEKKALHFEDIYPNYDCVLIQECNELAYFFARYLQSRGISVKVSGKYWNKIGKWEDGEATGRILTIYAEGTWEHNPDLAYELLRSVSVEFEHIDDLYKENIRRGIITNAKCSYKELIEELRDKDIILIGTGNRVQDAYDMMVAEGLDITAFLSARPKDDLKLLGKEIIRVDDLGKYANSVFIDIGKNGALGGGYLDEYVYYYGCKRNQDFYFFLDYTDLQRNNLLHVLQEKRIVLFGDELLSCYLKQGLVDRGKEETTIQYYKMLERESEEQGTLGVIVVLQSFGTADSVEKWEKEISEYIQLLRAHNITDYTLYFTLTNTFVRLKEEKIKYKTEELTPKGILVGAINAFSGNIFFRDCIDDHPNIIQLGFTLFENNMFYFCVCLSQLSVERIVPTLFELYERLFGEEVFQWTFPNTAIFQEKCDSVLRGAKSVTSQELFVLFALAYNEMKGRRIQNADQVYIYWEPHSQDTSLRLLYADWLAEEKVKGIAVYLTRNSLVLAGSSLKYSHRTNQRLGLDQLMRTLLSTPYILDNQEETDNSIILKFEDLKLTPRESWMKLCDKIGIPWSDTLLYTTRFGEESYFYCETQKMTTGYDLSPVYRDYADLFSPFDKMRILFCKAEYQKKYGYSYDNTSFTRKELQELYLKEFKCRKVLKVNEENNETEYILAHKYIQRRLNEIYINSFWNSLTENRGEEK